MLLFWMLFKIYFFLGFMVVYTTVVLYWKGFKENWGRDGTSTILFCLLFTIIFWPGLVYLHITDPEPIEW
jgi:hypothetical protein